MTERVRGLANLRRRVQRTQTTVADAMGTTQSGVARIERQDDWRLSTLDAYVGSLGGRLRLVVEWPDDSCELVVGSRKFRRLRDDLYRRSPASRERVAAKVAALRPE